MLKKVYIATKSSVDFYEEKRKNNRNLEWNSQTELVAVDVSWTIDTNNSELISKIFSTEKELDIDNVPNEEILRESLPIELLNLLIEIEKPEVNYEQVLFFIEKLKLPSNKKVDLHNDFIKQNLYSTNLNINSSIVEKKDFLDNCTSFATLKRSVFFLFLEKYFCIDFSFKERFSKWKDISLWVFENFPMYIDRLNLVLDEENKDNIINVLIENQVIPKIEIFRKRWIISHKTLLKWWIENGLEKSWNQGNFLQKKDVFILKFILETLEEDNINVKDVITFFRKNRNKVNFDTLLKFVIDFDECNYEEDPIDKDLFRAQTEIILSWLRDYKSIEIPEKYFSGIKNETKENWKGGLNKDIVSKSKEDNINFKILSKYGFSSLEEFNDMVQLLFSNESVYWNREIINKSQLQIDDLLIISKLEEVLGENINDIIKLWNYVEREKNLFLEFLLSIGEDKNELIAMKLIEQGDIFLHPNKYNGEIKEELLLKLWINLNNIPTINDWRRNITDFVNLWHFHVNESYLPIINRVQNFEKSISKLRGKLDLVKKELINYMDMKWYVIFNSKIETLENTLLSWENILSRITELTSKKIVQLEEIKREVTSLVQEVVDYFIENNQTEWDWLVVEKVLTARRETLYTRISTIQSKMISGLEKNPKIIENPISGDKFMDNRVKDHNAVVTSYTAGKI